MQVNRQILKYINRQIVRILTRSLFSICLLVVCLFIYSGKIEAASQMESPQFVIQMPNVNSGSDVYRSETATLSATIGQTAAERFSSTGYLIRAGFQYIESVFPFSFSVSNTRVDFGEMIANIPATASANLRVAFGGAGQYQVTAEELGPLATYGGGNTVPDTSCDDGNCTELVSRPWVNNSTPGFGYKMSGTDIPSTFTTCGDTCYCRFADSVTIPVEQPAVVMSSTNVTVDLSSKPKNTIHQSIITYKLNVSAVQAAGSYQTIIRYVATPSY